MPPTPPPDVPSLWSALAAAGRLFDRVLAGAHARVTLGDLLGGSSLGGRLEALRGRSVLLATGDQLTAAPALIELHGGAGPPVLCPPHPPAPPPPFRLPTPEAPA